jgi:TonB family protein
MTKEKKPSFILKPEYPGGPKALSQFIYEQLRYPPEALELGIEGVVVVEYDIDYQGNVIETRAVLGIGHGCDEEACRVVRLLKFNVGKNRGVHVIFHQKARVQFKKPAPQKPLPAPAELQVNYTLVPTPAPPAAADHSAQSAPTTFTYTINL